MESNMLPERSTSTNTFGILGTKLYSLCWQPASASAPPVLRVLIFPVLPVPLPAVAVPAPLVAPVLSPPVARTPLVLEALPALHALVSTNPSPSQITPEKRLVRRLLMFEP